MCRNSSSECSSASCWDPSTKDISRSRQRSTSSTTTPSTSPSKKGFSHPYGSASRTPRAATTPLRAKGNMVPRCESPLPVCKNKFNSVHLTNADDSGDDSFLEVFV